jgi:regulator of cell morphogenesis and NO signaling
MISTETTVAQLVLDDPRRARVLERLGLDYCCGGKRSLADACVRKGLDPTAVAAELAAVDGDPAEREERDWRAVPLPELCEHIVDVHHARLREELPRLSGLLARVVKAHGAEDERLVEVGTTFEGCARSSSRTSRTRSGACSPRSSRAAPLATPPSSPSSSTSTRRPRRRSTGSAH